jgi:ATP-dependent DNA helicase RecG
MNVPPASLDQIPVTQLKGVGPGIASKLEKLSIFTVQDVLFHLPFRYQDRTRLTLIGAATQGMEVVIEGTVAATDTVMARRRSLLCILQDGTGSIGMRFFHFSNTQKKNLASGTRVRCFGEVRRGAAGLELYHPEYKVLREGEDNPLEQRLTAIYPTTTGVNQLRLRALVEQALTLMNQSRLLEDWLPQINHYLERLPALIEAIHYVHKPPTKAPLDQLSAGRHASQQRLAFEELLAHHLSLRKLRQQLQQQATFSLAPVGKLAAELVSSLPFKLTSAQQRVCREIAKDMSLTYPMLRLIQGDVGSGKTVVAALAAIHAYENGLQTAIMAPTEILAEQHLLNLTDWLSPLQIETAWLSGKVKGEKRQQQLSVIKSGAAHVVIGTHALFQESVDFAKLGLIIIDEQHRFGVYQRLALREKATADGIYPHQLILTATPIPRTLAMSAYADLDCSIIDELPPGRTPVSTSVIPDDRREEVIGRVRHACSEGRQAYWVCTMIDESEVLQCRAAEATAQQLTDALPDLKVELIHGRVAAGKKTAIMARFKEGKIDLLVATTVIEVGVDVPNASLMIIENPERLGLAQLHQLRGRVGRGPIASHCVLMYHPPLSATGKQRLGVLRETTDGFRIAEEDLLIRGPGEILGTRQTGAIQFKVADLIRDSHMLTPVKAVAEQMLASNPDRADAIISRWLLHAEQFGAV